MVEETKLLFSAGSTTVALDKARMTPMRLLEEINGLGMADSPKLDKFYLMESDSRLVSDCTAISNFRIYQYKFE